MAEGAPAGPPDFDPQKNQPPQGPPNPEATPGVPPEAVAPVPTELTDEEAVLAAARRVVDDAWKGGGTAIQSPEFSPEEAVVAAANAAAHDGQQAILTDAMEGMKDTLDQMHGKAQARLRERRAAAREDLVRRYLASARGTQSDSPLRAKLQRRNVGDTPFSAKNRDAPGAESTPQQDSLEAEKPNQQD